MRKIFFAFCVLCAANAQAQLDLIGSAVGIMREARSNGTPFRNVDYTVDTIYHMGETAPRQRYTDKDLDRGLRAQHQLTELAFKITDLQHALDNMGRTLSEHKEIQYIDLPRRQLDQIERGYPKFDCSLFEAEYAFYIRFQFVKPPEVLEQEQEKAKQDELNNRRALESEDPHVITDFDRKLDSSYNKGSNDKASEALAHNKIVQIIKEQEQHREDSIAAVRKMEQQREAAEAAAVAAEQDRKRQAELTKKYGASNAKLIMNHNVHIGMTKAMCKESWGEPEDIHSTITGKYVHEQWVYSLTSYLYFDNGLLTAIQN